MKKLNLLLSAFTLFSLISFTGCDSENSSSSSTLISSTSSATSEKHKVTFVYNNGEESITRNISHGKTVVEPTVERQYYKLEGWYTDEACEVERWNFGVDKVNEDITLYAKWEVDFENWVWRLGRQASKSTIMLKVTHYNVDENGNFTGNPKGQGFGSGVIFAKKDGYYYALTNNHVVANSAKNSEGMDVMNYTTKPHIVVYDHYINPYTAELIFTLNRYDLALVRFKTESDDYTYSPSGSMIDPDYIDAVNKTGSAEEDYNNYQVKVAKFAESDPEIGANVSSYGAPIAQPGVCTIGTVFDYKGGCIYDHPHSSSYIHEFDVIYHSASILSGNSGGPLYDINLNIAGINYGSSGANDTYSTGGVFWAIPISKVREFLDVYVVANADVNPNGEYTFLGDF